MFWKRGIFPNTQKIEDFLWFLKDKMKKRSKKKIIFHEPPMKYNIALHQYEPDLPIINKNKTKNQAQTFPLTIIAIVMIVILAIIVYSRYKIY